MFRVRSGPGPGSGQLPKDETGSATTPSRKIIRTEEGLLLSLDDGGKTITLSDSNGSNLIKIETQPGQIKIQATAKVVVEAPQIELVQNATHPLVFGDNLLTYLNQLVAMFNSHVHPGQLAVGVLPVTPAPPVPPSPGYAESAFNESEMRVGEANANRTLCRHAGGFQRQHG